MSWSLALRNGDLALGGTQLATVTSSRKLVQDLRCALLEPMGTDDLHPSFGSLIDGGRKPDGTMVPSLIGSHNWRRAAIEVRAEINRIADEHRRRQLMRAREDQFTYGKPTLDPGELLIQITDLRMVQVQDSLVVNVTLKVGNGTTHEINIPISNTPVIDR
jgi:hypothetical protein